MLKDGQAAVLYNTCYVYVCLHWGGGGGKGTIKIQSNMLCKYFL